MNVNTQKVIISKDLQAELTAAIEAVGPDRLFVLTDTTTLALCWPVVDKMACLAGAQMITIGASDEAKTLDSVSHVWSQLQSGGATRHSLLVNLGGGMVTDLGGFAASTFKRGIRFVNVPTTLLAMVDASVGGKTGFNFGGLKNEIGVFNEAETVILSTPFLRTLDSQNILSGYAEMLKHGLISTPQHWTELLAFDICSLCPQTGTTGGPDCRDDQPDRSEGYAALARLVAESVGVKEHIVSEDPHEHGIRKALNLGHTVGHAFESLALAQGKPVLHGYAVAWGLVCELYLSTKLVGFPRERFYPTIQFIKENYGTMPLDCREYDRLYELMTHDKKNVAGRINFTLLGDIGDIRINQQVSKDDIFEALDFYREGS